eukprot:CAMPEP_0195083732 /NCGR_PEP_ID=MMETSP0448-20130528/24591_1 /TAXON_ID=66468 /ORGANISM="Heterocapsa triquestra, Strain CCMP 448" /LENGTH=535 /DNA_ID=CAMNT_0040116965 /DNA_START=42 /DNA_END=1646 /DNA_ORIENTATION=-
MAVVGEADRDPVQFWPMNSIEQVATGMGSRKLPSKPMQVLSLAIFVFLLGSGFFHAYLYNKFTPVYTETECGNTEPTIDEFTLGVSSIHVGLSIVVTCRNPNPYKIKILSSIPGRVFIGHGHSPLEVGKLAVMPGSFLQEEGSGSVHVRMSADITGMDADALLPHFLEDRAVPVTMELQFEVGISVSFGLGTWTTSAPFKKDCGLNMAGILVNNFVFDEGSRRTKSRLGPLVCRDSFSGMRIPAVGEPSETPEDGQMGFSAAQVAPTEVARGEAIKNISLGIMMTLSFGLSLILPYHIWIGLPLDKLAAARDQVSSWCRSMRSLMAPKPTVVDEQTRALVGGNETDDDPIRTAARWGMRMMDSAGGASGKPMAAVRTVCPTPWDNLEAAQKPAAGGLKSSPRSSRPESSQAYKGGHTEAKRDVESGSVSANDLGDRSAPDRPLRLPSPELPEARPMLAHASSRRARGLGELSDKGTRVPSTSPENSWQAATDKPSFGGEATPARRREHASSRGDVPAIMSRDSSRSGLGGDTPVA